MSSSRNALELQVGREDLVGRARIDVVGAFEHPALHRAAVGAHQIVDGGDRLLVGRGAGVEDVPLRFLALVLHRIEQDRIELLEHRQHRLARHRGPAAEHDRDLVLLRSVPCAFSANSGQFEAGSTTTASSFLPSTPPFLFCSSISISITSLSVVSLIAIVPESEWRMPILIVSSARAAVAPSASAPPASAPAARETMRLVNDMNEPRRVRPGTGPWQLWPQGASASSSQRACQRLSDGCSGRRRRICAAPAPKK